MKWTRHILGESVDRQQYCVLCGELIVDYSRAVGPINQGPPPSWPEGEFYIGGKTPTVMSSQLPTLEDDDTLVSCT